MTDIEYGALWFVLIVAAFVLWVVYTRARFPYAACRCAGGRVYSRSSRRWRDCRRCGGRGFRSDR